jgi:hypothetical protein
MLIDLLGRPAVEAALLSTGVADPGRDRPFLTPREMFILKLEEWPTLAARYAAAGEAGRRALLASAIDTGPLPTLASARGWVAPHDIDTIEWFASADDICRAYTSLSALARRPGLAPIAGVLEINDGGIGLDPRQWKTVWFKGGSEPGVLTLTYLATTRSGHSYVVAVLAENPTAAINLASASPVLLSAIKGALTLAAEERSIPARIGHARAEERRLDRGPSEQIDQHVRRGVVADRDQLGCHIGNRDLRAVGLVLQLS